MFSFLSISVSSVKLIFISLSAVPEEEYTENLVPGKWNLISFPLTSESSAPESLLEYASYYSMWMWDLATGGYVKPPDDQPVELGVGYWLKTDENRIRLPY